MISNFNVVNATEKHISFSQTICDEMANSAKVRGTGIAQREPVYVEKKMLEGKAVIAFHKDGRWAGFCYIETWSTGNYVANSGLIVNPEFRNCGLAKAIKEKVFALSRSKYPNAKIFGLTTGLAVMKINSDLGYEPVTYSELTQDEAFWNGCKSCINYDILVLKERKNCMCTGMLFDPTDSKHHIQKSEFKNNKKLYERFMKIKQVRFLKFITKFKNKATLFFA